MAGNGSDDRERQWRLRVRRAFEVPDIVSDGTATRIIAAKAVEAVGAPEFTQQANDIARLLPELGAAGQLDGLIWQLDGDPPPQFRFAGWVSGLQSDNKVLMQILDTLRDYVVTLPYGDDTGRYFGPAIAAEPLSRRRRTA
jgi:hypothetical protein